MQVGRVDQDTLRRLAAYESSGGPVLSIYLSLDPSEFALADTRSTAIRSLVDDAGRTIEHDDDLSHDGRVEGREGVRRVRELLEDPDFDADGAHGVAVFCAVADDVLEVVKLPRPVPSEVVVGPKPFVEPLVDMASGGGWCVLLCDRERARLFRGSADRLDEVSRIEETPARGRHQQGGRGDGHYERSLADDVDDHVKRTADTLYRRYKRAPFERLVLGATEELAPRIEDRLAPPLRDRVVGRIDVEVERANAGEVLERVAPVIAEQEIAAENEALDALHAGAAHGHGATGLTDVLETLTERRVATLLLKEDFAATGTLCPHCAWLGPPGLRTCPADGTALEQREDIVDLAIERALGQDAGVLVVHRRSSEVADLGGIAAVLRF